MGAQNLTKNWRLCPNVQMNFLTCQKRSYFLSFRKIHMMASVVTSHPLLNVAISLHTCHDSTFQVMMAPVRSHPQASQPNTHGTCPKC